METFDILKAKSVVDEEFKVLRISKCIPDIFVYLPRENTLLLNSTMLRIYDDFDFKKNLGHGILAYDHKSTTLDLFLNYNNPHRLDLENGSSRCLYVFMDPDNVSRRTFNATLDASYGKDRLFDNTILQFIIRKEDIIE
jgi:hypothetical protein